MKFAVWAPFAERVELELRGGRQQMLNRDQGWWELQAAAAEGDRYGYVLDGEGPFPDPRSRSQPEGVHGLSAVDNPAAHCWGDAGWPGADLRDAVIYEMHVGTFTPQGTFESAIDRLGHLVDLGVNVVEVLPVAEFSGGWGWGYDGVDLFAPHHAYGGPRGLRSLVDACHQHGLAVVMDVVYNHLGPEGNYLGRFGPYFTDRYATPWGSAMNYDGRGSDEVREFVFENAVMWLTDYHCDGLRLDAVHAIWDLSALHLLEELGSRVAALGEGRFLIAESDLNDPRIITPRERGGYGLDAQWSDDFHHALHSLLTGEVGGYYADFGSLQQLVKALLQSFVYDGLYSRVRGRRHGRGTTGIPSQAFLAYAQNHDQVGNRARGERLSQLVSPGRLRIAAGLVLLGRFVPMIFQGEEWGAGTPFQFFSSHQDPQLARATSEGRLREFEPFGWTAAEVPDAQAPATFQRSKLVWSELDSEPHRSLLAWHRELIRLRKLTPSAEVTVEANEVDRVLTLRRGPITLRCDFENGDARLL